MGKSKSNYKPNTLVKCNSTERRYERHPSMVSDLDFYIPNNEDFDIKFKMSKPKNKKGVVNIHKVFIIPVPKKELLEGLFLPYQLRNIDTELGVGVDQDGEMYVINNNLFNQPISKTAKNGIFHIERKGDVLTLTHGSRKTPILEKHKTANMNYMIAVSLYCEDSFYDKSVSINKKNVTFKLNDDVYIES